MKTDKFDLTKEAVFINTKLPEIPKRPRKNLFDILKIQHREIRNSNILAYFFNPNEDHSFGTLFYDSLQEIAIEKVKALKEKHPDINFNDISSFDEVKKVKTEEQTIGSKKINKSIDIVLEGDNWVIGIENKIHHHIANPLNIYWDHLKSKNKKPFGVLLTLFPLKLNSCELDKRDCFLNITHRELIERIQQNIQLTGDLCNTDIFYLQEYFKSIESHYFHLKHTPEMNTIIQEITENYSTISEILKKKESAENHIENQIDAIFSEYGYVKVAKWYRREDKMYDLYFYIPPASELMSTNSLRLYFEMRNQTNRNIDKSKFKDSFRNEFAKSQNFDQAGLASNSQRTHVFLYKEDNLFQREGQPFDEKIKKVLAGLIGADDSPVTQVEKYLEKCNHFFTG